MQYTIQNTTSVHTIHMVYCTVPVPVALLSNRTLVTLELGTNELSDDTAEKLGMALKVNPKLEGLSLWQNDITAEVGYVHDCK